MSGIFGIYNCDGAKVEEKLLRELTESLTYRGTDSHNIWLNNHIGFGHTFLKNTFESEYESQPFTLDHLIYIVADLRIDDRPNLINQLELNNHENLTQLTDVELVLRSYLKWNEDCINYLLGDFSFAIWDNRKKSLFCARDNFGIKPFFYAKINNTFLFASDIQTILKYPNISHKFNELAIADFLIFGGNQEENATAYENIYRLPAAHKLIITSENIKLKRYWQLPLNQPTINYKNPVDYIENYRELLTTAIKDRLRFNQVNMLMSGGIDSTGIAAIASQFSKVKAFTETVKKMFPDEEKYYAEIVAKHLKIDIDFFNHDDYRLYEKWEEFFPNFNEPCNATFPLAVNDFTKLCLSHSPIFLSGLGGDEVLYAHRLYYVELLKKGQIVEFCRKTWQHWQRYGTLQGLAIRSGLKQMLGLNIDLKPEYPTWIKPDLTKRLYLKERFNHYTKPQPLLHKTHPEAYQGLNSSRWSLALESNSYPFGLEVRYPFFDLRLINYVLAIPPIPWCFNKHIQRASFNKILPDIIVNRPKTPLQGDRLWCRINEFHDLDSLNLDLKKVGEYYIDKSQYLAILNSYKNKNLSNNNFTTSPISLEYWLQCQKEFKI